MVSGLQLTDRADLDAAHARRRYPSGNIQGVVQVAGVHELVANALNLPGQNERATNLRGEDFEELKAQAEGETDE